MSGALVSGQSTTNGASLPPRDGAPAPVRPPKVTVVCVPDSDWQRKVDVEEAQFADEYDDAEFKKNPALGRMSGDDRRFLAEQIEPPNGFSGGRFLVAGAGTGREVLFLLEQGAAVDAIDATRRYLEITAAKIERELPENAAEVLLAQSPIERFPMAPESYDGATSLFGVLNHVEGWDREIGRIAAGLKPGGMFVFSMYGQNDARVFEMLKRGALGYQPSILQRRTPGGITLGEGSSNVLPAVFPTIAEISAVLEQSGLELECVRGFLNFAALFPKPPEGASESGAEDVAKFLEILRREEPAIFGDLLARAPGLSALQLLNAVADIEAGGTLQRPERLSEFAYVGFAARKKKGVENE